MSSRRFAVQTSVFLRALHLNSNKEITAHRAIRHIHSCNFLCREDFTRTGPAISGFVIPNTVAIAIPESGRSASGGFLGMSVLGMSDLQILTRLPIVLVVPSVPISGSALR